MKVAIVGKNGFGGREHVLASTIHRQNPDTQLFLFPGNGGTRNLGEERQADSISSVIDQCDQIGVDLIIGGPEADFDEGLADLGRSRGIPVFGPSQEGARIETNKLFTKKVMEIFQVPTAPYRYFPFSQLEEIPGFLERSGFPAVIKANGLAAGKGVLVLTGEGEDLEEAISFTQKLSAGGYGGSGRSGVLVEEFLPGEEASLFFLVNTRRDILVPMRGARDHKRAFNNDRGPNTGGMGAYSENPLLGEERICEISETIARPVLEGLKSLGISYTGILYLGLMITRESARVVEINCRFGDPEIQALAPRLKTSLRDTLYSIAIGEDPGMMQWSEEQCVSVVLASQGYPDSYPKDRVIEGLDSIPADLQLIHAGTRREGNQVLTSGGRVLNLCALDLDLHRARSRIYEFLSKKTLYFEGMQYRTDIGLIQG